VSARRGLLTAGVALALLTAPAAPASAGVLSGLVRILGGIIEVPRSALAGTVSGFPVVGTAAGALIGVVRGAAMVTQGALETVVGAVPLALKALPFLPAIL
jgi:hypothetical protein